MRFFTKFKRLVFKKRLSESQKIGIYVFDEVRRLIPTGKPIPQENIEELKSVLRVSEKLLKEI